MSTLSPQTTTIRSTSVSPSYQVKTFIRARIVTQIEKRTRMLSSVITIFCEENRRMMKQKQAEMIIPLIASSWIVFWVGIQPQASFDVCTIDFAVTGSFDYQTLVNSSHFCSSVSFRLILSVDLMDDMADTCMNVILPSTTPTFPTSLAILPVVVVYSH